MLCGLNHGINFMSANLSFVMNIPHPSIHSHVNLGNGIFVPLELFDFFEVIHEFRVRVNLSEHCRVNVLHVRFQDPTFDIEFKAKVLLVLLSILFNNGPRLSFKTKDASFVHPPDVVDNTATVGQGSGQADSHLLRFPSFSISEL